MTNPLRANSVPAVLLGTVLWTVGIVVAVVTAGAFSNPWFWTCVVGIVSGVLGIAWLTRRNSRLSAQASSESGSTSDSS